jgi:hypothetical protein
MRRGLTAILAVAATLKASSTGAQEPDGDTLDEGVYLLKFEGPGRRVELTDGAEAILQKRLSPSVGIGGMLRSHANDNTRFTITINRLGPLPPEVANEQTALVVDADPQVMQVLADAVLESRHGLRMATTSQEAFRIIDEGVEDNREAS